MDKERRTKIDNCVIEKLEDIEILRNVAKRINPQEITNDMRLNVMSKQEIEARQDRKGTKSAAHKLLEEMQRFCGFGKEFLDALHRNNLSDLADQLSDGSGYRPPSNLPPQSPGDPPNNHSPGFPSAPPPYSKEPSYTSLGYRPPSNLPPQSPGVPSDNHSSGFPPAPSPYSKEPSYTSQVTRPKKLVEPENSSQPLWQEDQCKALSKFQKSSNIEPTKIPPADSTQSHSATPEQNIVSVGNETDNPSVQPQPSHGQDPACVDVGMQPLPAAHHTSTIHNDLDDSNSCNSVSPEPSQNQLEGFGNSQTSNDLSANKCAKKLQSSMTDDSGTPVLHPVPSFLTRNEGEANRTKSEYSSKDLELSSSICDSKPPESEKISKTSDEPGTSTQKDADESEISKGSESTVQMSENTISSESTVQMLENTIPSNSPGQSQGKDETADSSVSDQATISGNGSTQVVSETSVDQNYAETPTPSGLNQNDEHPGNAQNRPGNGFMDNIKNIASFWVNFLNDVD